MKKYYKFMNICWEVTADKDVLRDMDKLLEDYFKESNEKERIDFQICLVNEKYSELQEILEFGKRTIIHNSKKSAVHEEGIEYRNGLTRNVFNCATKSVYVLNYLSKKISIYNSDRAVLHKDGIRVVRDIVKILAEEKNDVIMLHAAALYKKNYGGIILVGGKGCGKTSISLELLYKYGFSEVSRDRIILQKKDSEYIVYGWPNYYNLTIRTMNSFQKTRFLIPKEYSKLPIEDMEKINKKIQLTAEDIGIEDKKETATLKHIFYLNNNAKGKNLDEQELLAISCYTPSDLNYPNWHEWGESDQKKSIMIAENLLHEIDYTVVNWSSLEEATEIIMKNID